ncbi:MAG: glycosyltransferase [Rhizobiales bacterium]|nr:glycosyltransferase [Hyphomicrobiales bacterium]
MFSVIIASHESERTLVPTLAALVTGATAGLLGEVVVADAGSRDATAEIADIAGCRIVSSDASLGARLKAAAASTRTPWLMFLRAGLVPEPGWIVAADAFMQATDALDGAARAAVFRPPAAADLLRPGLAEVMALLRVAFGGGPRPEQGLLIARRFYDAVGGHPPQEDAEAALLRQIGRRRIAMLPSAARFSPR